MITPPLHFDITTYPIANDFLIIRWYPSLTTADTTPGATTYGQYGYANDVTWVAGGDGTTTSYSFLTQSSGGGTSANSLGYASNTITAVPEPSSYAALVALFSLGLLIKHWGRKDSHA